MFEDKLITIRTEKDQTVPLTNLNEAGNKYQKIVKFGQHNRDRHLEGIGRKLKVRPYFLIDEIWEGSFDADNPHGFARWMYVFEGCQYKSYTGFWKHGLHHGYGRLTLTNGIVQEGLFEHGVFKENPQEIKAYDPEKEAFAQKVEFDKYIDSTNIVT